MNIVSSFFVSNNPGLLISAKFPWFGISYFTLLTGYICSSSELLIAMSQFGIYMSFNCLRSLLLVESDLCKLASGEISLTTTPALLRLLVELDGCSGVLINAIKPFLHPL